MDGVLGELYLETGQLDVLICPIGSDKILFGGPHPFQEDPLPRSSIGAPLSAVES